MTDGNIASNNRFLRDKIRKKVLCGMIEQIRKSLSDLLKQQPYTQTELALKIGVSQQQVSSYIIGKNFPSFNTLSRICSALDLDANEILCVERPKQF